VKLFCYMLQISARACYIGNVCCMLSILNVAGERCYMQKVSYVFLVFDF
jgi:hypothetical protein